MNAHSILLCSLGTAALAMAADETVVTPTLESVGLFKNGLTVVRASFPVNGPGHYRWDKVPRVVHGSFWVESDGLVSVQSTTRNIVDSEAGDAPSGLLQSDLAGNEVSVTLKASGTAQPVVLTGKVWELPPRPATRTWDADYSSLNANSGSSYYWYRGSMTSAAPTQPAQPSTGGFLVLEEAAGTRRYIDQASIASITVTGPFAAPRHREERPVLIFDVREAPAKGAVVRVTYLMKGLAWMPAYQVDLTDPAKLKIRQNAVVRNESVKLADTEIQLISGYPNVRFGSVDSPLWPGTGLAAFFQQLSQSDAPGGGSNRITGQMIASNSISMSNPAGTSSLPEAAELGNASDDIHYESIGKRSLKAGDSLAVDVAAAQAAYERVVEWVVPDPRDGTGRYLRDNGNEQARDDLPWDAVRFVNPFKFPMTTASAVVMEAGRFRGQSLSQWVNPGQRTCLRITKALSVRTDSSEVEEEGKREIVWIGGHDYQRTSVKGRLSAKNFRGKELTMVISLRFSGELLEAEGNPEKSLNTEGIASVNPRRQLDWTLKLPAGGEQSLNYRYQVLVRR
ncbi:MAG: hypothetical protein NTV46_02010 [Verrucomicrobia bacterium]|nr:hypothetical protein [Verrucomicrobiota bacterium]